MAKYILLKARVPTTFDGGFKASGYDTIEIVESDVPVEEIEKGVIQRIIDNEIKIAAVKKGIKKRGNVSE